MNSISFSLPNFVDAVVFNLSPSVIIKFADNTDLFISNVSKMAKLMAPSILFINGAHYPFIKKVQYFKTVHSSIYECNYMHILDCTRRSSFKSKIA